MGSSNIKSHLRTRALALPKPLKRRLRRLAGGKRKRALLSLADTPRQFDGYCFIAGLHRSGTSMIEHYIAAHFDVCTLRADVPENEGQHLQDVMPVARDHGGPGRFAFSPQMHLTSAQDPDAARDRLLRLWTPWTSDHSPILLEKSPPNLTRIGWLREVFPGALFIVVVRDPRANAAATQKWSKTSFEELIYHWHVAHSAAHRDWAEDCIAIRYEDFCDNPDAQIARIAATNRLKPRETPRPVDPRFASLRNTNSTYLASRQPAILGPGAWDFFGPWF